MSPGHSVVEVIKGRCGVAVIVRVSSQGRSVWMVGVDAFASEAQARAYAVRITSMGAA